MDWLEQSVVRIAFQSFIARYYRYVGIWTKRKSPFVHNISLKSETKSILFNSSHHTSLVSLITIEHKSKICTDLNIPQNWPKLFWSIEEKNGLAQTYKHNTFYRKLDRRPSAMDFTWLPNNMLMAVTRFGHRDMQMIVIIDRSLLLLCQGTPI